MSDKLKVTIFETAAKAAKNEPAIVEGPKRGRCYKSKDGEFIEVVCLATERPFKQAETLEELHARRDYVVIRHGRYQGHAATEWAIPISDWRKYEFVPITRQEFVEQAEAHVWSHQGYGWAIVTKVDKPHDSRDVMVAKVENIFYPEAAWRPDQITSYDQKTKTALKEIEVRMGRHTIRRTPLDGRTYEYRADAREAKRDWCKKNGVTLCTSHDHFGSD